MSQTHDGFDFREYLFLGSKISEKHKRYKIYSQLDPDSAKTLFILHNIDKFKKEPDKRKMLMTILFNFGVIDKLNRFGELTQLSMILGDPRLKFNIHGLRAKMRQMRNEQPEE